MYWDERGPPLLVKACAAIINVWSGARLSHPAGGGKLIGWLKSVPGLAAADRSVSANRHSVVLLWNKSAKARGEG